MQAKLTVEGQFGGGGGGGLLTPCVPCPFRGGNVLFLVDVHSVISVEVCIGVITCVRAGKVKFSSK